MEVEGEGEAEVDVDVGVDVAADTSLTDGRCQSRCVLQASKQLWGILQDCGPGYKARRKRRARNLKLIDLSNLAAGESSPLAIRALCRG